MTRSTCMYHTGLDPITGEAVYVPRPYAEKKAQKRMLGVKPKLFNFSGDRLRGFR